MTPHQREYIAHLLRCILLEVRQLPVEGMPDKIRQRHLAGGTTRQGRIDATVRRLVAEVLKVPAVRAKWTADDLFPELRRLVVAPPPEPEPDVPAAAGSLIDSLQTQGRQFRAFYPLAGLHLGERTLQLGNAAIVTLTPEWFAAETERTPEAFRDLVSPEELGVPVDKRFLLLAFQAHGEPCAIINFKGGLRRAREVTEEQVEGLVELLRYALLFIKQFPLTLKVDGRRIGRQGEYAVSADATLILSSGYLEQSEQWRSNEERPLQIDDEDVESIRRAGVFALAELWFRPSLKPFERALLNAVHWCADAMVQHQPANRFLSLMICLETLFGRGEGTAITELLTERVAVTITPVVSDRQAVKESMERAYSKRSKISHGEVRGVKDQEMRDAAQAVVRVMECLVQRLGEYRTLDEYHRWVDLERAKTPFFRPDGHKPA
jgi:Apea-like HEPN